jgi:hypothetical protein
VRDGSFDRHRWPVGETSSAEAATAFTSCGAPAAAASPSWRAGHFRRCTRQHSRVHANAGQRRHEYDHDHDNLFH